MGIASTYLHADDVTVAVWDGTVSGAEWERTVRQFFADDPRWPRGRRHLTDLTTFDPSELTYEDIDRVAALMREHLVNFVGRRHAIVAVLAWELARQFERRAQSGATTIVFNNLSDACEWLGFDLARARDVTAQLRTEQRANAPDGD